MASDVVSMRKSCSDTVFGAASLAVLSGMNENQVQKLSEIRVMQRFMSEANTRF